MKSIQAFLSDLSHLNVKLWVEGDRLRCNAPKGVLTPERRSELAERKAEIIRFLQQATPVATEDLDPIRCVPRDEEFPLSFSQQRLWFLNQLEEQSASYNLPSPIHLQGKLQITILEKAFREIVRRHEVLRTTFQNVNGSPVQKIVALTQFSIPIIDLQQLPEPEQSSEVKRLAIEEAQYTFDLSNGPLWRATLLKLGKESQVLLCNMHHIVSDGWSTGILIKELSILYQAYREGKPSPLPELSIQYADFAYWQRQYFTENILEKQLNYWKHQLAGIPPLLELPTDYPRPPLQTFRGGNVPVEIGVELTNKLKQLSQISAATLFMTLLAAFTVLLSRYSGQKDIVVGSPIANRNREEIEALIGFFVNTLVLRTQLEDNPSFEDLLKQVRQVALEAYSYQDVPFERLVEALQPERNLSHSPLFQVMFVLQNAPMGPLELPGLKMSPLETEGTIAKFDLTLSLEETEDGLKGGWEYNSDLFERATLERMSQHWQCLLEGIVANPQAKVAQLPLLSEPEKEQILEAWNNTHREYPQDKCIHQLFEKQVAKTPDGVAVVFEEQSLTYHQLNQKANQLAHYLQTLGVGPEVLVGICVERSVEMVIGLLGILKAGGAYVPLDPDYPSDRLEFMLKDCQGKVLLTQQKLVTHLPSHEMSVVCLDRDWETIASESRENLVTPVSPDNLAYVIYTSGSTGQPKGVLVVHQGLCNLVKAQIEIFDVQSNSRFLQFVSFSFDVATSDIFTTLCSGAILCLATKNTLLPGSTLIQVLRDQDITHVELPVSVLGVLPYEELPTLQAIIVGGEACSANLVKQWSSNRNFFNAYGPTESTVCTTVARCTDGSRQPSIGRPLANTQIYILDPYLQPVPIGVPGELHIGSVGLARGYLNRPDLTSEKFIPNPFGEGKLYKTGDLCRYLPDGNIEYIGRIDHQVKIRGFRIELGEIESLLSTHPEIRETVVVAREDQPSNKQLVAYVVSDLSPELNLSQTLREYLKEQLPEYMVPSAFVELEKLPLTPNGKIDRKALPAPDWNQRSSDQFIPPTTPTQQILASIWQDTLKIEAIGLTDKFFELGGHSLLATQIISRIRETFSIDLPLRSLFEAPTLEALAAEIESNQQSEITPITPISREENLPLSFAQQRLWFLDQLEGANASYNMPGALRLEGNLNQKALENSLNQIIERHESLRTRFRTVEGEAQQIIDPEGEIGVETINLEQLEEQQQKQQLQTIITEETQKPFNLSQDRLIRGKLIKLSQQSHILVINMHHIISDGWSIGVLIQELSSLYSANVEGREAPLTPLSIQYADYAAWQREWLQGEQLQHQLDYWQEKLQGIPPLLELPTDKPRPPIQSFKGSTINFSLNPEISKKLKQLSQRTGVTLFIALLSAFSVLLSRYSRQEDIAIGSPIANRNRGEIEPLIGFFVNTLVIRVKLEENPTVEELLQQVRKTCLEAYAHQDVPFEKLVEEINPERNMSYSPLFQVMFVLQNAPMEEVNLPRLTLSPVEIESSIAKFDLTLSLAETAEGLKGNWEYNTDLFEEKTIERMMGHFQVLLEAMVANPQEKVAKLPILTQEEEHKILVEWNKTAADYPKDKCIHQLFEEQVERTQNAVAVVYKEEQLTYKELNEKANQLAHYLQKLGVEPDTLVGICVERSLEIVIGLLGILKAGGAYVPIDSNYPAERIEYMLKDSAVSVLLTQEKISETLPKIEAQKICLDRDWLTIAQENNNNPLSQVKADNLAYVIYTSGSTGKPKGAMNAHQGVVNRLSWMQETYRIDNKDKILQKTPFSFDVSVWEFFWTLATGATLIVAKPEGHKETDYLVEIIEKYQITTLHFVPSMLTVFLENENLEKCQSLNRVICSGEALSFNLKETFKQKLNCQLHNLYGPTEVAIDVSFWDCRQTTEQKIVPIGKPVGNTQLYILDQQLKPVPVGISGELHIGGKQVGKGYLNRPDLTSEKFIPNPFGEGKLYKTGDLCRYLPDGNIEYIGRIDHQVKIRGFRIELGEIESLLSTHPEIRETVVVAREDQPSNKQLVAYVVPQQEPVNLSYLRDFLKEKLPDYMIPGAFVSLEALPLTPNGKVNRRALPAPDLSLRSLEDRFLAPRDHLEWQLAQIWSDILGVEPIGVKSNFFDLGGHSLLSVRLIAQIQQQFGKSLSLATLFQSPTIEQLASILRHQTDDSLPWSSLVAIQSKGSKPPFFCVPGAGGNVIYFSELARHLDPERPFYGFQSLGLDGKSQPHTHVEDMAADYIKALQDVQPQGPYFLGGHSFGGKVAFEMAQQLQKQGHEVALLAILDTVAPLPGTQELIDVNVDEARWLTNLATIIEDWLGDRLEVSYEELALLAPEEQLSYFKERLQNANLLPPNTETTQVRSLIEVFKTNSQIKYIPQEVYPTRIALFRCGEFPAEKVANEAVAEILQDPTWGWNQLLAESLEMHWVSGNHMTMMTQPHVQDLAEQLRDCIERTQADD